MVPEGAFTSQLKGLKVTLPVRIRSAAWTCGHGTRRIGGYYFREHRRTTAQRTCGTCSWGLHQRMLSLGERRRPDLREGRVDDSGGYARGGGGWARGA